MKECVSHVSSAVYILSESNNHANISHFKIVYADQKQVTIEDREAIHIGIDNSALNYNTGKIYIPAIFNIFPEVDRSSHISW